MSAEPSGFRILVFCDDPSHPKAVPVANFIEVPPGPLSGGRWHEVPASRAAKRDVGTGRTMIGDTPAGVGWANDPEVSNADVRVRHELVCRKCRRRVEARAETLFTVLDHCAADGESRLPLRDLAAKL